MHFSTLMASICLGILLPYNYIQMPQDVSIIGIQMNKVPHVVIVVLHGYEEKVV